MAILGVESAIYGVDDLDLCTRFFQDFGNLWSLIDHYPSSRFVDFWSFGHLLFEPVCQRLQPFLCDIDNRGKLAGAYVETQLCQRSHGRW